MGYSIPPGLSCTLPRPYSFPAACHRSFLSQWLAPPHVPWWPKELSAALEQDRKRQADSGWLDSRAPLICLLVAALRMRAGDLRIFILETPRQSSSTGLCASQLPRKFVPHFRQNFRQHPRNFSGSSPGLSGIPRGFPGRQQPLIYSKVYKSTRIAV